MDIFLRKLKNGIPVIFVPRPDMQTFLQLCIVSGGSRYERSEVAGISHLLEHMMFKGTILRPTSKEINEELDSFGGPSNAFTGNDYIGFYAGARAVNFRDITDLLADQILNSTLPSDELEKEKGAVYEEIHSSESTPSNLVFEILPKLMYGDQAAGRTPLGTEDKVRAITRRQLKRYMDRYFVRENFAIVIAGKIPEEEYALSILEEYYSDMPSGNLPHKYVVDDNWQGEPEVKIRNMDVPQTWIALGMRAMDPMHEDYPTLKIISNILGSGMSSRLFTEIREKRGLAYAVGTYLDDDSDKADFVVYGGMNPERTTEALMVIKEELKKLKEEPVSPEELRRIKNRLRNSLAFENDNPISFALSAGRHFIKFRGLKDSEEELRRLEAVTPEDIMRVAQDIFRNDNLNLAVVGPHEGTLQEEFAEAISF
ncbi:MAG: pitrilysin family protein [Candidatus Spechtbacterales bacterium]|nr:pitrilysin family protein [Candidatus Spechtbacterales bacterium]